MQQIGLQDSPGGRYENSPMLQLRAILAYPFGIEDKRVYAALLFHQSEKLRIAGHGQRDGQLIVDRRGTLKHVRPIHRR